MRKAVYPGSFDPFTNGHLDIVKRAARIFDSVTVLVASNNNKSHLFSVDERVNMIKESICDIPNVTVDSTSALIVDYLSSHNSFFIIRGLRNSVDFEYEYTLENNNLFLDSAIETVYLTSRKENIFLSSSAVREYMSYGVDCSALVPPPVLERLKAKFEKK